MESGERLWVEFLNRTHWCQNEFQVSNQITVEGRKKCRYDVTILINGLPLVQIELKRRGVELKQAYNQIQRYHKTSFHGLFDYIQLFVISNGVNTRYFANNPNSGYKFTFNWTDAANVPFNDLEKFATVFFDKCTLGKIIGKYIVLHEGDKCLMVLRPYQFYAVEKILDRVENSNDNGYIWHTTGAGKTLTSFKAAQLVSELDDVDKVMFVVDRHDLDTQTQAEYEAFEPGAVDSTDNTDELVKRLHSNSKIIITTIQKLNAAVSKQWYSSRIEEIRHSRIVMIFDECHRSHFGECHKNIVKFFDNTQIFGFTGTPIFVENAVDGHTTKEIFGNCLHKYLIKDAIADENVLGFLVEYYHGNEDVDNADQDRMTEIAKFILNNFNKSTLSDIKETKDFKKGNGMENKDNIPQFVNSDSFMADKNYVKWLSDLKKRFRMSQLKAAVKVNTEMLKFYWSLGEDICEKQKQYKWGANFMKRLSLDLRAEFPKAEGFSVVNLYYIKRWFVFYSSHTNFFYQAGKKLQEVKDVASPMPEILLSVPWRHQTVIVSKCETIEEATFYLKKVFTDGMSRTELAHAIETKLYEHTGKALNNFDVTLPQPQNALATEIIKDPYKLDFFSLPNKFSEMDLENKLATNITRFLLELGKGFAYVGRQMELDTPNGT